jgi:hypothetical protein
MEDPASPGGPLGSSKGLRGQIGSKTTQIEHFTLPESIYLVARIGYSC